MKGSSSIFTVCESLGESSTVFNIGGCVILFTNSEAVAGLLTFGEDWLDVVLMNSTQDDGLEDIEEATR
jgi:hypothetical protein